MKQANLKKLNDAYANKFGFAMPENSVLSFDFGLSKEIIENISSSKNEPMWMREFRQKSLQIFKKMKMPNWGPNLAEIDFEKIRYFIKDTDVEKKSWQEVPKEIKDTFDRLGVPQAERDFLAGVKAQYNSEVAYSSLQAELDEQGVIFCSMEEALQKHSDLLKE